MRKHSNQIALTMLQQLTSKGRYIFSRKFISLNLQSGCFLSKKVGRKVFLHDFHLEKNAKMVDFAGFEMPLQYSDLSISESHKHTREHVSVFDVSHMMQTKITGADRIQFMESLVVADVDGLNENQSTLTLFTTENGGIIDDLIVTKTNMDYLYVVSNAGCSEKDLNHMQRKKEEYKQNGGDVEIEVLENRALLAVQGPGMSKVLQPLVDCDLSSLTFMTSILTSVCGIADCRITRCGYTGEDGVEISVPCEKSRLVLTSLLESKLDDVRLAGLGARDTLRLEASLCLYGNDITEQTTPIEASLAWTISKKRRETANFPGASIILKQLKDKPKRKRVGFVSTGPCPRASCKILNNEGKEIGEITSGCPSPCLSKNISMGYVETASSKIGTKVKFLVHKKQVEGVVAKMPFVPTKYYIK